MSQWGTLGAIKDGKIAYNFSKPEFTISADLELLKQKLADAAITLSKNNFTAEANAMLELSLLDCSFSGNTGVYVKANEENITFRLSVGGSLDCGIVNLHVKGDGSLQFFIETDGTYYLVEVTGNDHSAKLWYDYDSSLILFNRFHVEVS